MTWTLGLAAVGLVVYLAADVIDKRPVAHVGALAASENLRAISRREPFRFTRGDTLGGVGKKLAMLADDCVALAEVRELNTLDKFQREARLVHQYAADLQTDGSGREDTEEVQAATQGITHMLACLQEGDFPALAEGFRTTKAAAAELTGTRSRVHQRGETVRFMDRAELLLADMKAKQLSKL